MQISFFAELDMVVPVPTHQKKRTERGCNQSEYIEYGIADCLHPILVSGFVQVAHTDNQTRQVRLERYDNEENVFCYMDPDVFSGNIFC